MAQTMDEAEQWKAYLWAWDRFHMRLGALQSPVSPLAAIYYLCIALILKHDRSRFFCVGMHECVYSISVWICVCIREVDRLTATCREVSQYVGHVHQPLILCDADLFEQPAGSHQHGYVWAERRPSKDKHSEMGRESERVRDWFALVIVNLPEFYN